jgi:type II secretion system protein N
VTKTKKILLYSGVGFFFFLFFLFWTFPYGLLTNYVFKSIETMFRGQYHLKAEEVSVGFSVFMKNVKISTGKREPPVVIYQIQELKIKRSILSLISYFNKKTDLAFRVRGIEGELNGKYFESKNEKEVAIEFESFGLRNLFFPDAGISLSGVIDGSVEETFSAEREPLYFVKVNLIPKNMKLDFDLKHASEKSFLSELNLNEIRLAGEENSKIVANTNEKGQLDIEEITFQSSDLELKLKGTAVLEDKEEKFNLEGQLKLAESFIKKGKVSSVLSIFESSKLADGSYPIQISGTSRGVNIFKVGNLDLISFGKSR